MTSKFVMISRKEVGYQNNYDIITFPDFTLDATSLENQELSTGINIQFYNTAEVELTDGVEIQSQARIVFSFVAPFPIANGNCYLELKFPKQFPL